MTKKHTIIVVATVFIAVAVFSISCGNAFVYHTLRNEKPTSFYNETRLDLLRLTLSHGGVRYIKVDDEDVFELDADSDFAHVEIVPIPRNKESFVLPDRLWLSDPLPGTVTDMHFTVYSKNMAYKREYVIKWAATGEFYVASHESPDHVENGNDSLNDGSKRTPFATLTKAISATQEVGKAGTAVKMLFAYYFHTEGIYGVRESGKLSDASKNELITLNNAGIYPIRVLGHDGTTWAMAFDGAFKDNNDRGPAVGLPAAGVLGIYGTSQMIFERIHLLPPAVNSQLVSSNLAKAEIVPGTEPNDTQITNAITPVTMAVNNVTQTPYLEYNTRLFGSGGAVITVGAGSHVVLGNGFGLKRRAPATGQDVNSIDAMVSYMPGDKSLSIEKVIYDSTNTVGQAGLMTGTVVAVNNIPQAGDILYNKEYFIPYVAARVKTGGRLTLQGKAGDGAQTWLDFKYGTIIVEPGGILEISGRVSLDKIILISGATGTGNDWPYIRVKLTSDASFVAFSDGYRNRFTDKDEPGKRGPWPAPDGYGLPRVNVKLQGGGWSGKTVVKGDYITKVCANNGQQSGQIWKNTFAGFTPDNSPAGLPGQFNITSDTNDARTWANYSSAYPDEIRMVTGQSW